jgi:threonine dehydrogenase-like Zn-dependent dehydrogenase
MLAARAYRDEPALRLEDLDVPSISEHEVLVRNFASGINRGTISLWRSGRFMPQLPTTLGYEIAGEVAEVGCEVRGVAVGQRVLVHSFLSCGHCLHCLSGESADCAGAANMGHIVYGEAGLARYARYHNGGLAEYVRVPAAALEPLPDAVGYEAAARTLSLGVSYHALSRLGPSRGATVLVNGITGAFGAAAALLAPLFGIARIIGIARSMRSLGRLAAILPPTTSYVLLEELGDDWPRSGALAERLRALAGDGGLDGALDFSPAGSPAAVPTLQAMRKGGTMVCIAGNLQALELPYLLLMQNSLVIRGSRGATRRETGEILRLIAAGLIDPAALISHRFTLATVNDAVRTIEERRESPLMVAVDPQ